MSNTLNFSEYLERVPGSQSAKSEYTTK